jgi:hypothetical protein
VIESWEDGRLCAELADGGRQTPRPLKGLDRDESTVLRWLDA